MNNNTDFLNGWSLFVDIEKKFGKAVCDEVFFLWLNAGDVTVSQAFYYWRLLQQGRATIRFEKIKVGQRKAICNKTKLIL